MEKKELIGLTQAQMEELASAMGEPAYRGAQLYECVYRQRLLDFQKMTAMPVKFRKSLAGECQASLPYSEKKYSSGDGTVRYLFRLADAQKIETVLMPEMARDTICVSTQAGCPVDCKFCLTGTMGFFRNLTVGEIAGQVLLLMKEHNVAFERQLNLVFMGMGEPMYNYQNVMDAIHLMADAEGMGVALSRMTLSTAGVVPGIEQFGKELKRPRLAISLNATTDNLRNEIMPLNRKWPIADLLKACREFPLREREKLTFEYVLLDGVNDCVQDAQRLTKLLAGLRCKVNLIGLNPGTELPYRTPSEDRISQFQSILVKKGIPAFIRKPRGRDIYAACGQLKLNERVQTTVASQVTPDQARISPHDPAWIA